MTKINACFQEQEAKITFHPGSETTRAGFIINPPGRCQRRRDEKPKQQRIPVRPIYKKDLDLWLVELGFRKNPGLEDEAESGMAGKSWNRLTVALRPRPAVQQ